MGRRSRSRQAEEQAQVLHAFKTEQFVPVQLNVVGNEPEIGTDGNVRLQLFLGQIGPNTFMECKDAQLTPDVAVQIGEYLAEEGRRIGSGLVTAGAHDLSHLKAA